MSGGSDQWFVAPYQKKGGEKNSAGGSSNPPGRRDGPQFGSDQTGERQTHQADGRSNRGAKQYTKSEKTKKGYRFIEGLLSTRKASCQPCDSQRFERAAKSKTCGNNEHLARGQTCRCTGPDIGQKRAQQHR